MSRMSSHQTLTALEMRRTQLEASIAELRGELRGIEHAILVIKGGSQIDHEAQSSDAPVTQGRRPRGAVKDVVLGLIMEHADQGLRSSDVVEIAKGRGTDLDRNSVASLLSRLSREGTLCFDEDNRRYKPAPKSLTTLRTVA